MKLKLKDVPSAKKMLCLLLFYNFSVVDAGPQEILIQEGSDTTEIPTTTVKPECARYPEEKVLFSSDNFPRNYEKDTKCLYHMRADAGKRVLLTFFLFDTESNSRCSYDKVEVYDTNGTKLHKFCGHNSNNVHVVSSKEYLFFNFTSDRVQEGQGFLASWEQVEEDYTNNNLESEGTFYISYPTSFIEESPEKICIELFQDMEADVHLKSQFYIEKKSEKDSSSVESENGWIFEDSHTPVLQNDLKLRPGENIKCFDVKLPKTNSASKGLVNFEIESDDSRLSFKTYKSISIYQQENYPLIQTDKGQYKAKDTIKFRVVILNHELAPSAEVKTVDELWIQDPKNRRMVQWKKVDLNQGLLQENFTLSEEPELGEWKVHFVAGPVSSSASFTVSEYVLPKFEVKITPPPAIFKDDTEAEFKVCATYTHGENVKGEISASFSTRFYSYRKPEDIRTVEVVTDVGDDDDCGVFKLKDEHLKKLFEKVDNYKLNVTFTEKGTGTTANEQYKNQLMNRRVNLQMKDSSREFIVGGFPYTGQFSVTDHSDKPVIEDIEICVALYRDVQKIRDIFNKRGIWSMDEEEMVQTGEKMIKLEHSKKCQVIRSNEDGIKFYVPMNNIPEDVVKLVVKATAINYAANETTGMQQPTSKLSVSLKHSKSDLSLSLNDKKSSSVACDAVFKPKIFFAAAKDEQFDLHYQTLSKGSIFKTGSFKVTVEEKEDALKSLIGPDSGKTKRYLLSSTEECKDSQSKVISYQELELPIDYSVSPSLKLIVFATHKNSTIGDSFTYEIEPCQRHKVFSAFSKNKVYPRSAVSLRVSAKEGSLCAVSATDKSVELLGNSNKITKQTVSKLQAQIGDRKTSRSENYWEYQRKCPKTYEVFKVFENSGINIVSDLGLIKSCELLTDAGNFKEPVYEIAHSQAFSAGGVEQAFAAPAADFAPAAAPVIANSAPILESSVTEEKTDRRPSLKLRSFFPENWLFDLEYVPSGNLTRELVAPDTITTWLGETFCLHEEEGLGVASPDNLLVKQDFFADINLPYSVKRGEVFPLNISIFNYIDTVLPVRAELTVDEESIEAATKQVDVCVKPKNNEVITLKVSALKLGEVNITVKATIMASGCDDVAPEGVGFYDALVKPLRVKPEGVPVEIVQSDFKCIESGNDKFDLEKLTLPDNVVEDSERAWISVTGDVMAPALENVGNLVRLPTGCGEQNMVGLVPNIYLLDYLTGVGKEMPEIEKKAKNYMNIGYKRQQNYRHNDGSYSIWGGKGNKDGSTWLTAFVVKAFSEASKYISVSTRLVQKSVDWLLSGQMENGCFNKRGYVHSTYLKGGGSDDTLTAFVLTALHTASKNMKSVEIDERKLNKARECMMKNLNTSDLYSTIVVAHAQNYFMGEGSKESAKLFKTVIENQANTSTGLKFWDVKKEEVDCGFCWWRWRPSSEAVEMTAYNVMSYVLMDQLPLALDSVKWLAKQRNSQGGFVSTQDTVVALQALSLYSQQVTRVPLQMSLDIMENETKLKAVTLNEDNSLLLQKQKLTSLPASLEVSSTGSGCAMVTSVLRYNTKEVTGNNGFKITAEPLNVNSVDEDPALEVCATYTGNKEKTGMVLIEVELVTGWEAVSPDRLINEVDSGVQRVEMDEEENKVVLYFDEMTSEERCINLEMKHVMAVEQPKDASVTVYDYYAREDTATVLYNMEP